MVVSNPPHFQTDGNRLDGTFNETISVELMRWMPPTCRLHYIKSRQAIGDVVLDRNDDTDSWFLTRTHFFDGRFNIDPVILHVYDLKSARRLHTLQVNTSVQLGHWMNSRKPDLDSSVDVVDPKNRMIKQYPPHRPLSSYVKGAYVVEREYDVGQDGVRTGGLGRDVVYWVKDA